MTDEEEQKKKIALQSPIERHDNIYNINMYTVYIYIYIQYNIYIYIYIQYNIYIYIYIYTYIYIYIHMYIYIYVYNRRQLSGMRASSLPCLFKSLCCIRSLNRH
jgi:hypothetical protein